jgi:CubicO group peptidase (beta-lactamase class C family)
VLTNVSGEPYQSYIRRTILEPLGMDRTTFDAFAAMKGDFAHPYRVDHGKWSRERVEPDGEVGAMGGLVTTVPDYARYVAFLLAAWPARDDAEAGPVRRASVRELALWHAPPFPIEGRPQTPTAYGDGLMNSLDPKLGRVLHHSGGLPGYGSHLLFLPDRGWGVFAFGNRTYPQMSRMTWRVAEMLWDAAPPPAIAAPSAALRRTIEAFAAAYAAGGIECAGSVFAVNFLLDTPAPLRDVELAALKAELGEGRLASIEPIHTLAGRFTLACEKGRLKGTIVLSPDAVPGIQKLTLAAEVT